MLSQTICEGMGNMQFLFYFILYIYAIFITLISKWYLTEKTIYIFHYSLTIKKISPATVEHKTSFCSCKILDPQ